MTFCGVCGTRLSGSYCVKCSTPAVKSLAGVQPTTRSPEQCFLDESGLFISNIRFVTPTQTYAMNGVTSVGTTIATASKKGPLILIGFGTMAVLGAFLGGGPKDFVSVLAVLLCLLLIALGIFWFTRCVPTYAVVLRTASGEAEPVTSKDKDLIMRIVLALNEAIVHRG